MLIILTNKAGFLNFKAYNATLFIPTKAVVMEIEIERSNFDKISRDINMDETDIIVKTPVRAKLVKNINCKNNIGYWLRIPILALFRLLLPNIVWLIGI